MRKHRGIASHKLRVAAHTHVGFQIAHRCSARPFYFERKLRYLGGPYRLCPVAQPHHRIAVTQIGSRRPARVVTSQRLAMNLRQLRLAHRGLIQATHRFVPYETAAQFQTNMVLALMFAMVSTWLGLAVGDWLKRVRR